MGLPSCARLALLRRGGLQSVHVRRARKGPDDGRAFARCMGRARRVRDVVRDPANCPEYREVDASPDSARRRRARTGMPGPRWIVRAIFAETDRYQSAGLGRRNGADGGIRGLWSVRAQAAGLTPCRDAVSAQRLLRSNKWLQPTPLARDAASGVGGDKAGKRWLGSAPAVDDEPRRWRPLAREERGATPSVDARPAGVRRGLRVTGDAEARCF